MKTSKFTEEQIAFALKQAEPETQVEMICRKLGISEATIDELRDRYRTSLTKACALFGTSRLLDRYQSVARDSSALLMRIKEIMATRVHDDYRRVHVVLRREG